MISGVIPEPPNRCRCLMCGGVQTAILRITVKGWPCVSCSLCRSRAFLNSPEALTTYRRVEPQLMERIESRMRDLVEAARTSTTAPEAERGAA